MPDFSPPHIVMRCHGGGRAFRIFWWWWITPWSELGTVVYWNPISHLLWEDHAIHFSCSLSLLKCSHCETLWIAPLSHLRVVDGSPQPLWVVAVWLGKLGREPSTLNLWLEEVKCASLLPAFCAGRAGILGNVRTPAENGNLFLDFSHISVRSLENEIILWSLLAFFLPWDINIFPALLFCETWTGKLHLMHSVPLGGLGMDALALMGRVRSLSWGGR